MVNSDRSARRFQRRHIHPTALAVALVAKLGQLYVLAPSSIEERNGSPYAT
jgi:hypothetical protein